MALKTFDTIYDSPFVQSVRNALDDRELEFTTDIVEYLDERRMPLERIKSFLNKLGMPDADFLGEEFYRRILGNLYDYFRLRDQQGGLDLIARDTQIEYQSTWVTNANGRRVGLSLCVSLSPLLQEGSDYIVGTTNWVEWMLPYFKDAITVLICVNAEETLTLKPLSGILKTYELELT